MSTTQSGANTNGGSAEGATQGSRPERTQMPLTAEEAEEAGRFAREFGLPAPAVTRGAAKKQAQVAAEMAKDLIKMIKMMNTSDMFGAAAWATEARLRTVSQYSDWDSHEPLAKEEMMICTAWKAVQAWSDAQEAVTTAEKAMAVAVKAAEKTEQLDWKNYNTTLDEHRNSSGTPPWER